MSRRVRTALFFGAGAVFGALLIWGLLGLPAFGHYRGPYGIVLQHVAVSERHATNVVAATTFDYRGFDTMGEEFILLAAATGLVVLLRRQRGEREEDEEEDAAGPPHREASDSLRVLGFALVGPVTVLGMYIVAHGHLTPGGGFQGGVIIAAAFMLVYLAGQYISPERLLHIPLAELAEGAGAAGFGLVGAGGLVAGATFLYNFLPLGTTSELLSAGTIPVLNISVGLEVAGSLVLVVSEFLDQRMLRGGGS